MLCDVGIIFSFFIHRYVHNVPGIPNDFVRSQLRWQREQIRITLVEAKDFDSNGVGGIVTGFSGGIGRNSITLDFVSSTRGVGINFVIYIYAEDVNSNDFTFGQFQPNSTLLYE